jgi:hypothetical protein
MNSFNRTGITRALFVAVSFFSFFPASVHAESPWLKNLTAADKAEQMNKTWTAYGGQMDIQFNHDLLHDFNIRVNDMPPKGVNWQGIHRRFSISETGGLGLQVPYGIMESMRDGTLLVSGHLQLGTEKTTINLDHFRLQPAPRGEASGDFRALQMRDDQNHVLFTLNHIHLTVDSKNQTLVMKNMDMHISPWLAAQLGRPEISGWVVGQAHAVTGLNIPVGAKTELPAGLSCAGRPLWEPNADVDVQLTSMNPQFLRNLGNGTIVVAPSASLKNVGSADVPWYQKFSGIFDPYNNDQHPYLVWNMYRVIDNRLEQIGTSGIKHAFLTINSNCTINCGNNHILWPGCEDVYGVGNNDSGGDIGPRQEVASLTGIWSSTCSFFDPGCTGGQTNSSNGTDENRLVVKESAISDNSLTYYFSAWYPNRADVNIYNSMGWRQINPVPVSGSGWNIGTIGGFSNGPVIDTWVAPGTLTTSAASARIEDSEGHATFAVKVIDLGGGLYRYHYAVDNYDVDAQFDDFSLSLNDADSFSNFVFSDADNDDSNNWSASRSGGLLTIQPNGRFQDWGELNSFSFTTSAAPMLAGFAVHLAEPTGNRHRLHAVLAVPNADLIWRNSLD